MRETIQDGAITLLGETVNILNDNNVEYIIVGGWSPFLLNSLPYYPHPGTKDVDILFKTGTQKGELKSIIEIFLNSGFIQSAKHPFQLLKEIEINGYRFMYNIDLLHPSDQEKQPEMFVDHIDFPVKESEYMRIGYSGKTIILPKSDFFFNGFYTRFNKDFVLTNGTTTNLTFNLLDEAGLILSKSKSAFNAKRSRDAYDIFLAIKQCRDLETTMFQLKHISQTQKEVFTAIEDMCTPSNIDILVGNVSEWCDKIDDQLSVYGTREVFYNFFTELDIPITQY